MQPFSRILHESPQTISLERVDQAPKLPAPSEPIAHHHNLGMNYGGGGLIESSGEKWVLSEVVSRVCKHIDSPILFDVDANVGDYAFYFRERVPAAIIYAFEPAETVYQALVKRIDAADADRQIKPYNWAFQIQPKLWSYSPIRLRERTLPSCLRLINDCRPNA